MLVRSLTSAGCLAVFVLSGAMAEQPTFSVSVETEPLTNSNALMKEHAGQLQVTASSSYNGWGTDKLVDGEKKTSWFSAAGDSAAQGKQPWIKLEFPIGETVRRVTLLGNREPTWSKGFSVLRGKLELIDSSGKVLWSQEKGGQGEVQDFDFRPPTPVRPVRFVRFTSLKDEGDQTTYKDIALAELLVE